MSSKILAPHGAELQRADGIVFNINPTGQQPFQVELAEDNLTVEALKEAVLAQAGTPMDVQQLFVGGVAVTDELVSALSHSTASEPVTLSFDAHGSGAGVSFVTDFPGFARFDCLCQKCGLNSWTPATCATEQWCSDRCLCIERSCGPKDLMTQQLLCLKVECSIM